MSARNGKIARLPAKIRDQVNQRILDGQTADKILAWVNDSQELRGPRAITPQNLSEWRAEDGGFEEWKDEQEHVEHIRQLSEYALRLGEAAGGSITDGSAAIAGGRILEMLETADDKDFNKLCISLGFLRENELNAKKIEIAREKLKQRDRQLELEEQKFRRTTAELFLKWFDKEQARKIAAGTGAKEVKMDQLVQLMFGAPVGAKGES